MSKLLSFFLLLILLTGCVLPGTRRPTAGSTPVPNRPRSISPTHTSPAPLALQGNSAALPPLRANPGQPFGGSPLAAWTPGTYTETLDSLPVNLLEAENFGVITGLTNEQQFFLGVNGFVVAATQEQYFHEIRDQVAKVNGQPYYLTTDAAYHALDLTLEVLLESFEREVLLPQVTALTGAVLEEALQAVDLTGGTPLQEDAKLAAAYLAVAQKLLDPLSAVDPRLEPAISRQVQQIQSGEQGTSILLPSYSDDFSIYKPDEPPGASPQNIALHQGLTWFERATLPPGRVPLLLTLALRRANVHNEDAGQIWARLYETLYYLKGSVGGYSPLQYAAWMDEIYGSRYTYLDLRDEENLTALVARTSQLPPSEDPPLPGLAEVDLHWRLFPAPYTVDDALLSASPGSGLYLMSGLGSPAARSVLESVENDNEGVTSSVFAEKLDLSESSYLNNLNNNLLYAFQAQVSQKSGAYPAYMRTDAWARRDLNAALTAWTGWKQSAPLEVVVPEPQPSAATRSSSPPPAYVEPNPDVFFRLAYLSQSLVDGLRLRGYTAGPNQFLMAEPGPMRFDQALFGLSDLSKKFSQMGMIAVNELEGKEPTNDERWVILSCLGPVECTLLKAIEYGQPVEMPSTDAVVTTGITPKGGRFQAASGKLDRIFVAVPLEGKLQIAQGGVFSYYEFSRSAPYTTEQWRKKLSNPPNSPDWTAAFRLPGGAPASALAIRQGDMLLVTPNGEGANLRAGPSTDADILQQLLQGDILTIQAGPVEEAGYTWWFVRLEYNRSMTGWVAGDPLWFERVY